MPEQNCAPGWQAEGAAVSGSDDSAGAAKRHDPIVDLVARIRAAAEAGAPLANAARVRVRRVRPGLYRVERS